MRSYVSLDSYTDGLGQEVKVGDIVLYPRMRWSSPRVTVGKIVNIRQREGQGWRAQPYTTVRVAALSEQYWGFDEDMVENAKPHIINYIIGLQEVTLATNYKNLIKIDPSMCTGIFKDVVLDGKTIVVYSRRTQIDKYTVEIYRYTLDENGNEVEFISPLSR